MAKKDKPRGPKLIDAKNICKLELIKAEYGQPSYVGAPGKMVVRVTAYSTFGNDRFIDIDATNLERLAIELTAVAAMVRAKVKVGT